MNIIRDELPPKLPDNTFVAIDSEWFGMEKTRMHRPFTGQFACMTVCYKQDEVYLILKDWMVKKVLKQLDNCIWLFHNAKFDITHLRRLAKIPPRTRLIDTMLIDRILWNGLYSTFGLDDLARRYLKIYLDKSMQQQWETMTSMSADAVDYSVKDADILLRIWTEQKKHLTQTDFKIYKEIDLPAMWAVMDMRGFALDVSGWKSFAEDNKAEFEKLSAQLGFNPRSSDQVVTKLREHGFKGLPSSGADVLEKYIAKYPDTVAAKEAEIILEAREFATFSSKYGKKWLDDYLETFDDGSQGFVADYYVIGAKTGRMSASDPPMHGIPVRATKEFRKKFIARPNCKLLILDFSQQEVMIEADITQDKALIDICNSGDDIYILMANWMYQKKIKKSDVLRKRMKSVVLGIDYGMTEYGLAEKENISKKEAAEIIYLFREKFPSVSDYLDRMEREKTLIHTVSGRKFWLNPYSGQCYRNALNSPIQGTAADIVKLAVARIHRNWKWDCPFGLVNVIHDELVLDVPENLAQEILDATKQHMIEAAQSVCPGMKFRVDAVIANTWAEKE